MENMGFSIQFINFIKILYQNSTSIILNNLITSHTFTKRTKTRLPPSLPLYVIQGEITTTNINKNENIKGIKIPNETKEIKIIHYANDSNFLLTKQKSIQHVI